MALDYDAGGASKQPVGTVPGRFGCPRKVRNIAVPPIMDLSAAASCNWMVINTITGLAKTLLSVSTARLAPVRRTTPSNTAQPAYRVRYRPGRVESARSAKVRRFSRSDQIRDWIALDMNYPADQPVRSCANGERTSIGRLSIGEGPVQQQGP